MSERTVGDTAPPLTGNVNADLTGASMTVNVLRPDGTVISRPGTPSAGTGGAWSLTLVPGDLTVSGRYLVETEVIYASGKKQTFADDTDGIPTSFYVRDQIG